MGAKQKRELRDILISLALFLLALAVPVPEPWHIACFLPAYCVAAAKVLRKALKNCARGRIFDENFLMAVASLGALCIGEGAEAVFVMLFYRIGELFESLAVASSRASVAALMDIRPEIARVERNGGLAELDPGEVGIGEIIYVHTGERIPLDGVVEEGTSRLDTASLTGEAAPEGASWRSLTGISLLWAIGASWRKGA